MEKNTFATVVNHTFYFGCLIYFCYFNYFVMTRGILRIPNKYYNVIKLILVINYLFDFISLCYLLYITYFHFFKIQNYLTKAILLFLFSFLIKIIAVIVDFLHMGFR